MKVASVPVEVEYTKFEGGLIQDFPAISFPPGAMFAGSNYVAGTNGGYRKIDGYERYSGQPAPSDADYVYLEVTFSGTVSVGDTITGDVSGETGQVIVVGSDYLDITKASGTFVEESFKVGGVAKGTITGVFANGEINALRVATAKAAAADVYRDDISAPAGSGPVRGLGMLKGTTYCFRDNVGATAGLIFKPTVSGWEEVDLYFELSFDTGVGEISDGDSITQLVTGATADVKRVVLESGAWGSTAAGRLILDNIAGPFSAINDIQVSAATQVTSTSLATQITILPGGRYETRAYNFSGSLDTRRLYGCDGVNRGFEFDGDTYVPINTGMTTDTPEYVYTHKKQLFFSFKASSQNSGPGTPYEWTAISGAAEIAVGDDITGYLQLPGEALAILSRNSSHQLVGNSVDDIVLYIINEEIGCIPRTAQNIGYAYCFDDRGITKTSQSQDYGNFRLSTISRNIQPAINLMRQVVVASTVYRSDDQYRVYGSDGSGICMTIVDGKFSFSNFLYPDAVSCSVSGEDSTGKDVVFLGFANGMVCQANKGSSFDGEDIEAFIMLPFNNSKSPTMLKTYRKGIMEMSSEAYTAIKFSTNFGYGDLSLPESVVNNVGVSGVGGVWDVSSWGEFFYDTEVVNSPSFRINGTSINMSITAYSKSSIDLGHKLDGIIVHYTPRRIVR